MISRFYKSLPLSRIGLTVAMFAGAFSNSSAGDDSVANGEAADPLLEVSVLDQSGDVLTVLGRLNAEHVDGTMLLEEPNGRLHVLRPEQLQSRRGTQQQFTPFTAEQMSTYLLELTGSGFSVHKTDHFLICSDASEVYTQFCGRLVEKVHLEFSQFFRATKVVSTPDHSSLPVIIFRRPESFQTFAAQQHPNTDFTNVPGYYSVRDNLMLISALPADGQFQSLGALVRELRGSPRQVETIVHEVVHLLAFNTGLQVRYADNPLWFSEGLAVYFEHASGSSNSVWSRPGGPNRIHLPGFRAATDSGTFRLPLSSLISSDAAFQSTAQLADAYAEAWAVVYHLVRHQRTAFDAYAEKLSQRQPLQAASSDDRIQELLNATNGDLQKLEADVIRSIARVRGER